MTQSFEYERDAYQFLPEFQLRILALTMRDPKFMRGHRVCIEPDFFDDFAHRDVCGIIVAHFDKYGVPPDTVELAEAVENKLSTETAWAQKDPETFVDLLVSLETTSLGTMAHVAEQAVRFAKHQAMKTVLLKGADSLPDENYAEIEEMMRWALAVGVDSSERGVYYSQHYEGVVDTPFDKMRGPVPTGIESLDKLLKGGLGKKEFGLVAGRTGIGKTLTLLDFAVGALMAGRNVFFASAEVNADKLTERVNRRIAFRDRKAIQKDTNKAKARIRKILSRRKGDIHFKRWNPFTATVRDIDDYRDWVEQDCGRAVDIIVCDYLDKFKPQRERERDDLNLTDIAEAACSLSEDRDIPFWSGSQVTSDGMKAKIVKVHHLAGGRAKANSTSVILTLNQTDAERDVKPLSELRMFVAKNRDFAAGHSLKFHLDYERSRLVPR